MATLTHDQSGLIAQPKKYLTIERRFYTVRAMEKKRTLKSVEAAIAGFFRENRRMPTYAEMMPLLGVRSKSVVHFWIKKLLDKGLLEKDGGGFFKPARRGSALPLLGDVAAGFPSPAEEELRDVISLDDYLITRPNASFLLKAAGDSMAGAGIMDGDLLIVEKGREPKNGDIVIAQVDGEWTVKYFRKQGKKVFLEAANPRYSAISPQSELRLEGIVTAVVRKYHL